MGSKRCSRRRNLGLAFACCFRYPVGTVQPRPIMSYKDIWAGVFCEKCFQPILVFSDEAWKEITARPIPGATRVTCPRSVCSHQSHYPKEQFARFRVEEIP